MKKIIFITFSLLLILSFYNPVKAQQDTTDLKTYIDNNLPSASNISMATLRTVLKEMVRSAWNRDGDALQVAQFSSDATTWHSTFTGADIFVRFSTDGSNWTYPLYIRNSNGKLDIDSVNIINLLAGVNSMDAVNLQQVIDSIAAIDTSDVTGLETFVNDRIILDNQTLSIDSTGRSFEISIEDGNSIKLLDTNTQLTDEQVATALGNIHPNFNRDSTNINLQVVTDNGASTNNIITFQDTVKISENIPVLYFTDTNTGGNAVIHANSSNASLTIGEDTGNERAKDD